MHFGLFSLMTQRDSAVSARQLYQELVEQGKLAEQIGFEITWFAEHHFSIALQPVFTSCFMGPGFPQARTCVRWNGPEPR